MKLLKLSRKKMNIIIFLAVVSFVFVYYMKFRVSVVEEIVPVAEEVVPAIGLTVNITTLSERSWISHPDLPRKMTRREHDRLLKLLVTLRTLFTKHGIDLVLVDGTLLGSYFFHDILPWDDDLDVMVSYEDRFKVFQIFRDPEIRQKYGVTSLHSAKDWYAMESLNNEHLIDAGADLQFKFFPLDGVSAGAYEWKWPFVDVKYYKVTGENVEKYQNRRPDPPVPYRTFFPLKLRPLGNDWFLAPRDTRMFLKAKFTKFLCLSHDWNHMSESFQWQQGVQCSQILPFYPHVHRIWVNSNDCHETLLLGDRPIHRVSVTEPKHTVRGYYDLIQEKEPQNE